jgi:hypothetical protein
VAQVRVAQVRAAQVRAASRNSSGTDPAAIRNSSRAAPDRRVDKAESDRVQLALNKVAPKAVRVYPVGYPSSSAIAPPAIHNSNKADLDRDPDKGDPAKPELAKVAQDQLDRANSADKVRAADQAFPSKAVQGRRACPVSRAHPINSATEAPRVVRKAHESRVRKALVPRAHKALSASTSCARSGKGPSTGAATPLSRRVTARSCAQAAGRS